MIRLAAQAAVLLVSSVAAYAGTALCVIADETWRWVDPRPPAPQPRPAEDLTYVPAEDLTYVLAEWVEQS